MHYYCYAHATKILKAIVSFKPNFTLLSGYQLSTSLWQVILCKIFVKTESVCVVVYGCTVVYVRTALF